MTQDIIPNPVQPVPASNAAASGSRLSSTQGPISATALPQPQTHPNVRPVVAAVVPSAGPFADATQATPPHRGG